MATLGHLGIHIPRENVLRAFTPWCVWEARDKLAVDADDYVAAYSGVYVLAHFDGRPPRGAANPLDQCIIYIGEGGVLGRRWYNFQRSISGKPGHSGGHAYRRFFKRRRPSVSLHVAALPIWLSSEPDARPNDPRTLTCRLRHHVEQALLWHHFYRKSRAALLNRK